MRRADRRTCERTARSAHRVYRDPARLAPWRARRRFRREASPEYRQTSLCWTTSRGDYRQGAMPRRDAACDHGANTPAGGALNAVLAAWAPRRSGSRAYVGENMELA